jgi:hypothetical protein
VEEEPFGRVEPSVSCSASPTSPALSSLYCRAFFIAAGPPRPQPLGEPLHLLVVVPSHRVVVAFEPCVLAVNLCCTVSPCVPPSLESWPSSRAGRSCRCRCLHRHTHPTTCFCFCFILQRARRPAVSPPRTPAHRRTRECHADASKAEPFCRLDPLLPPHSLVRCGGFPLCAVVVPPSWPSHRRPSRAVPPSHRRRAYPSTPVHTHAHTTVHPHACTPRGRDSGRPALDLAVGVLPLSSGHTSTRPTELTCTRPRTRKRATTLAPATPAAPP